MSRFHFKQFHIDQHGVTWKVGTDGILLGAWTFVADSMHVLDIGGGTGLLSLMIAQRNQNADVTAIEIDAYTCKMAAENFKASPWRDRLSCINTAIQEHQGLENGYDLIISNPPFFADGLAAPGKERRLARSGSNFDPMSMAGLVSPLLAPSGRVALICPNGIATDVIDRFDAQRLSLLRRTDVRHSTTSLFKRSMLEFGTGTSIERTELTLFESGEPTFDHAELIRGFRDAKPDPNY